MIDEHPVAAEIRKLHAGGGNDLFKVAMPTSAGVEEMLPGVSRIRPGHLADNQPADPSAADLSAISDEMLAEIIRDGRDHLPPVPNAEDYEDLHITQAARAERARRLLSAKAGKPFTAE